MTGSHHFVFPALPADEVGAYLRENSGLPGPRANLELADAFAATASEEQVREYADSDDEYLSLCGTSERWAQSRDPLVQRAAIAAICEPRLLKDPATASLALELCRRVTTLFGAIAFDERRREDVRVLRQALGYCWSVAIAASPVRGLELFAELDASSDPDLQWIARENRKKTRLQQLL